MRKVSQIDGYAASIREERKRKKYSEERLPGGYEANCIPLVFEHFGRWGSEAEDFWQHLAKQSSSISGSQNISNFKNFWRKRLSNILQQCNTQVMLKKLSRLSCSEVDIHRLFDVDIQDQVH